MKATKYCRKMLWTFASLFLLSAGTSVFAADNPMRSKMSSGELEKLRGEARNYEYGEGVTKDTQKAVELYCVAARNGDAESQYSLGWMYANGRGVPRNDEMASLFFQMAVKQGHEHAKKMMRFVGDAVAPLPDCMKEPEEEAPFEPANPAQEKVLGLVRKLAPEYGVSPRLVMAVIRAESNFESEAVSPKNAQGLMQLIPETSARFNVKKPFDPEQNIRGGMAYLRWLLAYFEGNVPLVAAAYNAGEGAVNRYKGVPPYAETQGYVARIMRIFPKKEHPYNPGVTEPSPELPRIKLASR